MNTLERKIRRKIEFLDRGRILGIENSSFLTYFRSIWYNLKNSFESINW